MSWVLAPFILPVFFTRDFFLLRMGPRSKASKRLTAHSLMLLASVVSVSLVSFFEREPFDVFIIAMICLYTALCLLSVAARQADRHDLAWLLAAAPNPLLALGLGMLARSVLPQGSAEASIMSSILLAGLWIALMIFCVKRVDDSPMSVPDLDFSVSIAAVINSVALLTLVI